MKYLWLTLLLILPLLAQYTDYPGFKKFTGWQSDSTTTSTTDTSPPDTFDTAPTGTVTEPNQIAFGNIKPYEIDSLDWQDMRIYYTISGGSVSDKSFSSGKVFTKATLYADTNASGVFDTTLFVSVDINSYSDNDTVTFIDWYIQLRDSSGNTVNMATIKDTFYCHQEERLAVDSIYVSTDGDSLYVRINGSPSTNNAWAVDTDLRYFYGVVINKNYATPYVNYWREQHEPFITGSSLPYLWLNHDGDIDNQILGFPLDQSADYFDTWGGDPSLPNAGDSLWFYSYTQLSVQNHPTSPYDIVWEGTKHALDSLVYPDLASPSENTFNYVLNFILR